jgi:ankyrin repeat protein
MAHALERTQEERERAEQEKDLLAMKISQLEAKMLTNAERIEDTAEFQEALERERTRLGREHASQAAKMEAERERLEEEKAAFERERLQWQQQTQRQKTEQRSLASPAPPQQSPVSPERQPLPPGPRPGSSQRQRSSRLSRRASDAMASQPALSPQPPTSPKGAEETLSSSPLLKENLQALQRELNGEEVYDTVQQLEGSDSSDSDAALHATSLHDLPPAYDMPYAYASTAAGPPPLEGDGDGDGDFWAPVHAVREARLSHPERDDAGSTDNALSLADLYAVMAAPTAHTATVERYRRALAETGVGLPRTSRRIRLSLYENVVSGTDTAGWFMAHMEGVDTMTQAQTAGQILVDLGILATARGVGSVRGGRDSTAGDQFQIHKNQLYRLRAAASAPSVDAALRATSVQPHRRASVGGNSSTSSGRNGVRPQSSVSMRSARSSVSSVATFATAFSASSDGDTDDFFEQDEAATTASQLHVAAAQGDLVSLRALASELPVDLPDALGRTPLMYAIIANRGRACKFLLKRGAAVNVADAHGHTALLWAACRGNRDALKVLLTRGADLGLADTSGRTAIHWACKIRRTTCLEQLLRKSYKAAANHPDVEGQRPLHWAVLCGHHEHVALLLRQQADACQGDLEGRTPLHYAVNTCQLTCLRVLLSANPAAANAADSMGRTPLHLASGEELDETEDVVAAAGGTAFDLLMATPMLDINQVDARGTTALHWAAVCNRLEICTRLLQAGARRDARDAAGNTPADYAREKGYVSCFNLLEGQELVSAARQAAGSRQARPPSSPVGTTAGSSSAGSSQTSSSAGIPRERTDVIPAPVDNSGVTMRMPSARPFSRAMPTLQVGKGVT